MKSVRSVSSSATLRSSRHRRKSSTSSSWRSAPQSQSQQQQQHMQLYKHPLEGDHGQTLIQFFSYLWKKDGDLNSCREVLVPEVSSTLQNFVFLVFDYLLFIIQTIVYEHSFPRGWYGYDLKHREMRLRTGKDLEAQQIMRAFCHDRTNSSLDIVASYLSVTSSCK